MSKKSKKACPTGKKIIHVPGYKVPAHTRCVKKTSKKK